MVSFTHFPVQALDKQDSMVETAMERELGELVSGLDSVIDYLVSS